MLPRRDAALSSSLHHQQRALPPRKSPAIPLRDPLAIGSSIEEGQKRATEEQALANLGLVSQKYTRERTRPADYSRRNVHGNGTSSQPRPRRHDAPSRRPLTVLTFMGNRHTRR